MPKKDPRIIELREYTCELVERAMDSKKYQSVKDAFLFIQRTARRKRQATGFDTKISEDLQYNQFRCFKHSLFRRRVQDVLRNKPQSSIQRDIAQLFSDNQHYYNNPDYND